MMVEVHNLNFEHKLLGLEPDNLLAFLALLGLLKALEYSQPELSPRISWQGSPPTATLHLSKLLTRDDVVKIADSGLKVLGKFYDIMDKQPGTTDSPRCSRTCSAMPDNEFFSAEKFRKRANYAYVDIEQGSLLAALASDVCLKSNSEQVESTPLRLIFGQGHQHFPSRLKTVANSCSADGPKNLENTLFDEWKYNDKGESFRWDPNEDRRYAYQFGDPSMNKIGTMQGANRLAAIGFSILTSVPTGNGLATLGFSCNSANAEFSWPLPCVPTSLVGHIALLSHPSLTERSKARELSAIGVLAISRTHRIQVDRYFNFERAIVQFL